jgi:hypothetical protein
MPILIVPLPNFQMISTDETIVAKLLELKPKLIELRAKAAEILLECREIDIDDNSLNTSTIHTAADLDSNLVWMDGMLANNLQDIDEAEDDLKEYPKRNFSAN